MDLTPGRAYWTCPTLPCQQHNCPGVCQAAVHNNAVDAAYRAGREDAARDLETKIVAGAPMPGPPFTALSFREYAAEIARGGSSSLGRSTGGDEQNAGDGQ